MPRTASKTNDLLRIAGDSVPAEFHAELDPADPWDAMVLAEAAALSYWTGISASLYHTDFGTCATTAFQIGIDRTELQAYFSGFTGEALRTAMFFALAHEFGHLYQFRSFGIANTFSRPSIRVEAHADALSGAWLGMRLALGDIHSSDDLVQAALQLHSGTPDYPTAFQRSVIVAQGMSLSAMVVTFVDSRLSSGSDYQRLESGLTSQDVVDLYGIAKRLLDECPPTKP